MSLKDRKLARLESFKYLNRLLDQIGKYDNKINKKIVKEKEAFNKRRVLL